ncbi:uncharacterized protein RMCC_5826 [Mycolicibacterium canariasense]|uniref:Uncharacterized protein n=1 Tax=Mycolicibacterium canariasense TaxID=228230 RepID=A0A100WIL3_MYCCR|nr:uncharacterized protein RMCC_5826 [Mycolicibacterium canariasense]
MGAAAGAGDRQGGRGAAMRNLHFVVGLVFLLVCIPVNAYNGIVGNVPAWLAVLAVVLNVVGATVIARAYRRSK